jgi:hypothetical protein
MKPYLFTLALFLFSFSGCFQEEPAPKQAIRALPYVPFIDSEATRNSFVGRVVVEWIEENEGERKMRLVEPFSYIDNDGIRWDVPAGHLVDGASIPQSLWSVVGSPYVGKYRKASVIHDYYCDVKTAPSGRVHKMFYDAMLASGVESLRAGLMYEAVDQFGPSWRLDPVPEAFVDKQPKLESALKKMMDKKREENSDSYNQYFKNRDPN